MFLHLSFIYFYLYFWSPLWKYHHHCPLWIHKNHTKTFINLRSSFSSFPFHTFLCLPNALLQFPVSTSVCSTCVLWFDDMWLLLTAPYSLPVNTWLQHLVISGFDFVHLPQDKERQEFFLTLALILLKKCLMLLTASLLFDSLLWLFGNAGRRVRRALGAVNLF